MMAMVNSVMGFCAVLIMAYGLYNLTNLKSQITPIVALSVIMDIVIVGSLFGQLKTAVALAYLMSVAVFLFSVYKNKNYIAEKTKTFFSPGVVFFVLSSLLMLAFLCVKQPLIHGWDEYSFWGMSRKLIKEHGQLYTYYPSSMLGKSYPPALPLLVYFFQPFGGEFIEWASFFAYDVLLFACFCAFTAAFDNKNKNIAFMSFLTAFLAPFFFAVRTLQSFMDPAYISLYSDFPLAIVFSGIVAIYFFSESNDGKDILSILPTMIFLSFIKDMGFALSCIALFIIFFDLLVYKKDYTFAKLKGFFAKCAAALIMLVTTFGSFMSWSYHMVKVLAIDRSDLGGSAGMSPVGVVLNGIKELLIGPQTEKFAFMENRFITALFDVKVSMIGPGIMVIGMITVIFIIAFILSDKKGRKRCAMMYVTSFIGFVGYYIFHLFLYVYIFGNEAYSLASYERYIYTYYLGWLNIALINLYYSAAKGKKILAKTATIGFACCMLLVFGFYTEPENIFVGVNDTMYGTRKAIHAKADVIRDNLDENSVVYLYCGEDYGEKWFTYTFELSESYIIPNKDIQARGNKEKRIDELRDRFEKYGVTHVVVDTASKVFEDDFGELFDVGMYGIGGNNIACYEVDYDTFTFRFVEGGVAEID